MNNPQKLITENLNIWTAAIKKRGSQGRGSSKKIELHGIKKLRELILELAVRGLLVPQNPNDEPASVLLEKISAEKAQLIKDGKIKKQKPLPEITDEVKPFELPKGWEWKRLCDVYDVRDGTHDTPKYQLSGYPLVTSKNLSTGKLDLADVKYISSEDHKKIIDRSKVDKQDILFAMIGSIGNPVIVDVDIEFSIKNVALFKYYSIALSNPRFLHIFLLHAQHVFKEQSSGAVQSFVSLGKIRGFIAVIPPEAAHPRIVAKVDALMALCDQLAQQTENSLTAHQTLVETLLNSLLDAAQTYPGHASGLSDDTNLDLKADTKRHKNKTNSDPFQQAWLMIWENFDALFTTEHSIDQLKQTILQLAVMGKLVPQDPNDEPASVLLEKIAAEKEQLLKDGKIKKQKPLPEISEDEKPFELPKGWEWIRFGNIYELEYGNNLPKGNRSNSGEYPVYGSNGVVGTHNEACVTNPCIVVGRKGSAGALNLNNSNGCWVTDVAYSVIPPKYLLLSYVYLMFHTLKLDELGKGIKPGLSRNEAYQLATALPPEAEQPHIVAKVDELMALCDTLNERIRQSKITQLQLADAMAEQALT